MFGMIGDTITKGFESMYHLFSAASWVTKKLDKNAQEWHDGKPGVTIKTAATRKRKAPAKS